MGAEKFNKAKSAIHNFAFTAGKIVANEFKEPFEFNPNKLNPLEDLIFKGYVLGTVARPLSSIMRSPKKMYHYLSVIPKVKEGKPGSIRPEEKARGIFIEYLGDYKEAGNVQGVENIPLDRPFIFASNHWNGNPFRLDPRLLTDKQTDTSSSFRHDPLKGFWQVPVIEQIIRDTIPEEPHRRIRFVIEVRKYILNKIKNRLSELTNKRSDRVLDPVADYVHGMTEHIMANMARTMDFISKETGTREVIETIRKKHDILGVFPSGQAEYALNKGLPEAGKVFERAAEVDKKNPAISPTQVLPIACWFDGQKIQVRIGKPMLCSETKGDKESSQKTVDKVMVEIGSMLPEDMWGEYENEISQLKQERNKPVLVYSRT